MSQKQDVEYRKVLAQQQPWASGRVLTDAQREKKRDRDRITKRERKATLMNSLTAMEEKVANLETHIADLKLRPTHLSDACTHLNSSSHDSTTTLNQPEFPSAQDDINCDKASNINSQGYNDADCRIAFPISTIPASNNHLLHEHPHPVSTNLTPGDPETVNEKTILSFLNNILSAVYCISPSKVCSNRNINQDVIIRGVLEGWTTTLKGRDYVCPLWILLCQIDKNIGSNVNELTRLWVLYGIHLMFLYILNIEPISSLPVWYRPRPSQLRFLHSIPIDYLAWPGLRERLVLSEGPDLTDHFWLTYLGSFRLDYAYPLSTVYELVPQSGLYRYTALYESHVRDIRRFYMADEFFLAFPETYDDIIQFSGPIEIVNLAAAQTKEFLSHYRSRLLLPASCNQSLIAAEPGAPSDISKYAE